MENMEEINRGLKKTNLENYINKSKLLTDLTVRFLESSFGINMKKIVKILPQSPHFRKTT
jgi:hypothetical protein